MKPNRISLDLFGDTAPWLADGYGTGGGVHFSENVKAVVKAVVETELTPLQRELVYEYYNGNTTITEMARKRGVNKSSVSRSLKAARERVGRVLRYGGFRMWESD